MVVCFPVMSHTGRAVFHTLETFSKHRRAQDEGLRQAGIAGCVDPLNKRMVETNRKKQCEGKIKKVEESLDKQT